MKVIILAGGLGTRLRGTIGDLPKPLAPIGDKPFLEYLLRFISQQGFRDIIISCGLWSEYRRVYCAVLHGDPQDIVLENPLI